MHTNDVKRWCIKWYIKMVDSDDVNKWTTQMVFKNGLYRWWIVIMCRNGQHKWSCEM